MDTTIAAISTNSLGVGAIITPLEFSNGFTQNLILLAISTLILWIFNFIGKKNTITTTIKLLTA